MEELLTYVVKALVEQKDDVKVVSEAQNERNITLKVYVNSDDLGKVIGKNGKVANALRAIIKSASTNKDARYFVKIMKN